MTRDEAQHIRKAVSVGAVSECRTLKSAVRHLRLDVSGRTLCGRKIGRAGGGDGFRDCRTCERKLATAVNEPR